MSPKGQKSPTPKPKLRSYLKDILDDLPNTLPNYNEAQFLDDLTFLLRSPLFIYAISPRLASPPTSPAPYLPPTPMSMSSSADDTNPDAAFDLTRLDIRIRWTDNRWAAQLTYNDAVLLEGRQMGVEQEVGFVQSFLWFVEEAAFLACEYRAREGMVGERAGVETADGEWRIGRARRKDAEGRQSLKLKIRFRGSVRGRAGVWRVE